MTTFCGVMDFPPPVAEKSYNNIINKLQLCSKRSRRSFNAKCSFGRGDKTGKCIDAEVMSSFCKGYDSWKRQRVTCLQKKWKILHVKECLKNHNGSAGMMETVGMVRIFQRSLSHRSVRYTSYIGDGDSKTFSSITASNPYGEDITVSKIECVGHVQKEWELKAELAQVPKKDWVAYLLAVLPAELSNMPAREPTERANNYYFVKELILKRPQCDKLKKNYKTVASNETVRNGTDVLAPYTSLGTVNGIEMPILRDTGATLDLICKNT
ncbi:uncharacterized protein TNCV_4958601 [Trichonephila clavipes]|nr:uncharacterized protein TNCV_4958601 [Trichonephila clavipes]